jgi:paraquat-inducible protein B
VFYRRTHVGRVSATPRRRARRRGAGLHRGALPAAVGEDTRFWNASGIDLTINASGLTLNTQTLASVLAGGIAFENPAGARKPAAENAVFTLFNDRSGAMALPDGLPIRVRMVFDSSVRGLTEGAAIDFLGIEIGRVTSIALQYDPARKRFPVEVFADIFPMRLGAVRTALLQTSSNPSGGDAVVLQQLVAQGVRSCAPATCLPGSSTWPSTSSARSRRARR